MIPDNSISIAAARTSRIINGGVGQIAVGGIRALHAAINEGRVDIPTGAAIARLPAADQRDVLAVADGDMAKVRALLRERFPEVSEHLAEAPAAVEISQLFDPIIVPRNPIVHEGGLALYGGLYALRAELEDAVRVFSTHRMDSPDGVDLRMDIDPSIASLMLSLRHPDIRDASRRHVRALARALSCGRFGHRVGSIAFDSQGYLIDGQHRLEAVRESGACMLGHLIQVHYRTEHALVIDPSKPRRRRTARRAASGDGGDSTEQLRVEGARS